MKNHGSMRFAGNRSGVPIAAFALAMVLVALFCLGTEALAVRPELRLHSRDYPKNNYIGGALPEISLADIYFENRTEPGRYCFKFIFSRIGRDKVGKVKKGKHDDPKGVLFMGRGIYWKDILHLCPKFQRGAPEIWPQLRGKMIPPIRFNVTYKIDYWEVTQKYGSWIPVKGVNWATAFPISQEKWESLGGGKIRLIQDRRGGLAPGHYMIRISVLAKLDQWYLKTVVKKAVKSLGAPGLLCAIAGWTAGLATDAEVRYLLRVPGKVPPVKGMQCPAAKAEIEKRRLTPVARGNLRSGTVTKMGPAPGTWWWKGQKVHLVCGTSGGSDPDDSWYGLWKLKSKHTKGPVFKREKNPTRKSVMDVTKPGAYPKVVWGGKVVCNEEISKADQCVVSRNKIVIKTHHATGSQNKITYTLIRRGDKLAGGSKFVGLIDGQEAEGTYTGYKTAGSKRKGGGLDQTRESDYPGEPQEREINILEN